MTEAIPGNKRDASAKDSTCDDEAAQALARAGISQSELATAVKVLGSMAALKPKNGQSDQKDGLDVYKSKVFRSFRKALSGCMELQRLSMFNGKSEEEHYDRRFRERSAKRQKQSEADLQKNYLAGTALRRGRLERLKAKQDEAREEEAQKMLLMVPDGHVETQKDAIKLLEDGQQKPAVQLPKPRSCYVCKKRFRDLHHFYDQLCPPCAALNWEKRHQTCNLAGRVAVVTGSRVKIGFQTCLKLLRAGAAVVATTRFPNSAAECYRAEPDFNEWKGRLLIYGLDLRDITGLEAFTRYLKAKFSHQGIDMLINNACQTIRRPSGYYLPMLAKEKALWSKRDAIHEELLHGCSEFEGLRRKLALQNQGTRPSAIDGQAAASGVLLDDKKSTRSNSASDGVVARYGSSTVACMGSDESSFEASGISYSTAMSQMVVLPEDMGLSDSVLPPGVTDINGQQLDLRKTNSWVLKLEEVSTPEVIECLFINALAPFVLNSRLKPLMTTPDERPDRFIVNVSAMEGKFYRYKMPNHPHTNMAKAALNMMVRTSAENLAKEHRVFMNAVDTGWINEENPLEKANRTAEVNNFQTPIDEIDAAARILDPIFSCLIDDAKPREYGKFLKDYQETEW